MSLLSPVNQSGLRRPATYDGAFFAGHANGMVRSAQAVVPMVLAMCPARRVVDVGCGLGAWLRTFQNEGVEVVHGYDGDYVDRNNLFIDPGDFHTIDLNHATELSERYDLAVCLEVGEHLAARAARGLVDLLTKAAPLVLFSAAVPGQGGTGHVNEQWPAYWKALFDNRGYCRLDPFRPRMWRDERVEIWYRQNMFLFASEEAIAASSVLQEEKRLAAVSPFELIATSAFSRLTHFRGVVRELPPLAWRAVLRRLGKLD